MDKKQFIFLHVSASGDLPPNAMVSVVVGKHSGGIGEVKYPVGAGQW